MLTELVRLCSKSCWQGSMLHLAIIMAGSPLTLFENKSRAGVKGGGIKVSLSRYISAIGQLRLQIYFNIFFSVPPRQPPLNRNAHLPPCSPRPSCEPRRRNPHAGRESSRGPLSGHGPQPNPYRTVRRNKFQGLLLPVRTRNCESFSQQSPVRIALLVV